jgi:hypothetical protein
LLQLLVQFVDLLGSLFALIEPLGQSFDFGLESSYLIVLSLERQHPLLFLLVCFLLLRVPFALKLLLDSLELLIFLLGLLREELSLVFFLLQLFAQIYHIHEVLLAVLHWLLNFLSLL